jgi:DNA-binding FadR family transcriptional regulator
LTDGASVPVVVASAQQSGPFRSGYELAAEQIRMFITEMGLQSGHRMPTENELAARMGISRTVIREAVRIRSATELRAIEAAAEICRQRHPTARVVLFDRGDDVREARRPQRQSDIIGMRGRTRDAVDEHTATYQAIPDGDPDAAAWTDAIHVGNILEDYREEIQRRVFG